MPGDAEVHRMVGNTEHDMLIGSLIERTSQMSRQAEKLEQNNAMFNRLLGSLNTTLTKMQGVLDGIIQERREEKLALAERHADIEKRLKHLEGHKDDLGFIKELRAGWTKVLVYGIITAAVVIIAAAKLGAVVKFGE